MQRSAFLPAASLLLLSTRLAVAAPAAAEKPGPVGKGVTLLPNGWRIAPAGSHLDVGDLPARDGDPPRRATRRHHEQRLVEAEPARRRPRAPPGDPEARRSTTPGSASPGTPTASGSTRRAPPDNSIREVEWDGFKLEPGRSLAVRPPQSAQNEKLVNAGFMGGLALTTDGSVLYAAQVYGKAVAALELPRGSVLARRELARRGLRRRAGARRARASTSRSGAARASPCSSPRTLAPIAEIESRRAPERHAVLEGRPASLRRLRQHQRRLGG